MASNKTLYVIDLRDKFSPKLKKAGSNYSKFDRKIKKSTSKSGGIGSLAGMLPMASIGIAAVGAAALLGAKKILSLGAAMEQTRISFQVMLGGSSLAADEMVKNINALANVTPFVNDQLFNASRLLLNFGVSQKKVLPTLKLLGDASGGNAHRLGRMALAFGQINAAGRLMGMDLLQLINAGFNPLQEISAKTGKTMLELKKDMEKGLISFDMVQSAFIDATTEGGRFFGMMEKQAKTFTGLMSTLSGKLQVSFIKIGEKLADSFKPTIDFLIEKVDMFADKGGAIDAKAKKEINRVDALRKSYVRLSKAHRDAKTDREKLSISTKLSELLPTASIFNKEGTLTGFDFTKGKSSLLFQEETTITNLRSSVKDLEDVFKDKENAIRKHEGKILGLQTFLGKTEDSKIGKRARLRTENTILSETASLRALTIEKNETLAKINRLKLTLGRANKIGVLGGITEGAAATDLSLLTGVGANGSGGAGDKTKRSNIAGISSGGIKNVTLNIDKLIEEITFANTTTNDLNGLKSMVTRILVEASTDATRLI